MDGEERRKKLQWFAACYPPWESTIANCVSSLEKAAADDLSPFGISVLAEGVNPVVE